MIPVSPTLAEAIDSPVRHIRVRLSVDWDQDCHGPPGSIDDLSAQIGALTIDRALSGAWPQGVEVAEGSAAASLDAELVTGNPADPGQHAAWWFSRTNPASPLAGKERLARPCTVDIGFTTTAGVEWVRRFTGTTRSITVSSGRRTARLQGLDFRERLRKTVVLPPIQADYLGLNATWIVSYALHQCGVHPSPAARTDAPTRLWMPMHGSPQPHQVAVNNLVRAHSGIYPTAAQPAWRYRTGPFVPVPDLTKTAANVYDLLLGEFGLVGARTSPVSLANLSPLRIELWYLGVRPHYTQGAAWPGLSVYDSGPADELIPALIQAGIDDVGRMRFSVSARGDFARKVVDLTGPTIPNDGKWHFLGWHINIAAQQVLFKLDSAAPVQVSIGAGSGLTGIHVAQSEMRWHSPIAELQVTGPQPSTVWLNELPWTRQADVDLSTLDLDAVTDTTPKQAWTLLADLAAAEQAGFGFDEAGYFTHRTRRTATPTPPTAKTLTAQRSITELDGLDAIDQVANHVAIAYTRPVIHPDSFAWVWRNSEFRTIAANTSLDIWATPDTPAARVDPNGGPALSNPDTFSPATYVTAARNPDGTNLVGAGITMTVVYWDAGTLQVRIGNTNPFDVYLANPFNVAPVGVAGRPVRVEPPVVVAVRDATSLATYGEQPYAAPTNPWIQRRAVAATLAQAVLTDLATADLAINSLEIIADPRLQLGDVVRLVDTDGLALDGRYLLTGINETVTAQGRYSMRITARRAPN